MVKRVERPIASTAIHVKTAAAEAARGMDVDAAAFRALIL